MLAHLKDALTNVKGIGPKKQQLLRAMGINTLEDALTFFPFRYEDWSKLLSVRELYEQETAVFLGRVTHVEVQKTSRRNLKVVKALLDGEQGEIVATWYNRYQIEKYLRPGTRLLVYGRVNNKYGLEIQVQDHRFIKKESELASLLTLHPIYSLTEGIGKVDMFHVTDTALGCLQELPEVLSEAQCEQYGLLPYRQAIHQLHRPKTMADAEVAFESLVVYEFLSITLWSRATRKYSTAGRAQAEFPALADEFVANLPYELTGAQKRAIEAVLADMRHQQQMHRLLQGDVGSGKTNVAFYAMLAAVSDGHQAALMAPTEVLARQHYANAQKAFAALDVNVGLLTGQLKKKEKEAVLTGLANGSIQCVIGTHALIEDPVQFQELTLVVIDEQHRFGVRQREKLEKKGAAPDLLITTATPIPRSLALTVYGDLQLTVIDEMPKNRQKIQSMWINSMRLDDMYGFVHKEIARGRQAYVVCPLVEESEKIDLENAISLSEQLQNVYFPEYTVGLLHGRMSSEEKDAVMAKFREGHTQVLVSTTVIEVGVDVANATIMVIMNAERFGLSQLHQLRGRVGRGSEKSYCILVSDTQSQQGQERLKLMATSSNGFEIAEEDLRQRGPGELLGLRQHGQGLFQLARPGYHQLELEKATRIADELAEATLSAGAVRMVAGIEERMVP